MSTRQVKQYSASFKCKVVLETLKEEETISQIASRYQIDPKNIHYWRKQFLENAEQLFDQKRVVKEYKDQICEKDQAVDELHRQIGQLTAKLNWAKKKSREAGLEE